MGSRKREQERTKEWKKREINRKIKKKSVKCKTYQRCKWKRKNNGEGMAENVSKQERKKNEQNVTTFWTAKKDRDTTFREDEEKNDW